MKALPARLAENRPLCGTLVTVEATQVAEVLSAVGMEWLFIDTEHSATLDSGSVQRIAQTVAGTCYTLVRVPTNDETWIKHALDALTDGVIVPHVRNAHDAQRAVSAAKYPPLGSRSVGIARAHRYGLRFSEYIEEANDRTAVVVQIEDADAVTNIASILEVPGVDAVFIGPYDLSGSMGLLGQVQHADVQAAVAKVREACHAVGMPLGIFVATAEAANTEVARGTRLIAVGTDLGHLAAAAGSVVTAMTESTAE